MLVDLLGRHGLMVMVQCHTGKRVNNNSNYRFDYFYNETNSPIRCLNSQVNRDVAPLTVLVCAFNAIAKHELTWTCLTHRLYHAAPLYILQNII